MFDLGKLVRPNIKTLQPYSSARDEFSGTEGVFLDANENPYGTLNRYPDPYQMELKKAISAIRNIEPVQIFLGNGSDEAIDLLYRIFCEPGEDQVLIFTPTYGMYTVSANVNNIKIIDCPLTPDFQLDVERAITLAKPTEVKLAFICSPNNPTGNTLKSRDIKAFLRQFKGIVVIDEAYIDFSTKSSWLERLNEFPNLVVLQTFSKAWGLAAARLGVAYASTTIIKLLNKVKPPYNISALNQQAGLRALDNVVKANLSIKIILEEKEILKEELAQLSIVEKIYPSDANFLFIEVGEANKVYTELIHRMIIVRNRHSVMDNCIRITIGTKDENQALLNALKKISL